MSTLELNVYEIFKSRFSEKEAEVLLKYIDSKAEEKIILQKENFITNKDKETLLTTATAKDNFASKQDIAKLETKIAEKFADTLKWMIVLFAPFYIGMIVFLIKQFL